MQISLKQALWQQIREPCTIHSCSWGCQMCSANILKVMHYCLWFDIMSMYFALMIEYKDCMVCRGDDVPGPGIFSDYTTGDWHSVPAYWPETPNRVKLRNSRSILLAYTKQCFLVFISIYKNNTTHFSKFEIYVWLIVRVDGWGNIWLHWQRAL